MSLRGLRAVETRLANLLGDCCAEEALRLLALELAESEDELALVSAIAAVGAVAILALAQEQDAEPGAVIGAIRSLMAPTR
jgi:hypothetical protein